MLKSTAIMLAPNGARLTQADHPALPMSIAETLDAATAASEVGAQALHAHVRNEQGTHTLDQTLYNALLTQASKQLGVDYPVQITTESVGIYEPSDQITLIEQLKPRFCSIALRELLPQDHTQKDQKMARELYHWAYEQHIGVQHILYGADDIGYFLAQIKAGVIPSKQRSVLIVLGRYGTVQLANIEDVAQVGTLANQNDLTWMLCAFGQSETQCLAKAAALGGGVRIGFENSRENTDGSIAADNTERVKELNAALREQHVELAGPDHMLKLLGARS